jgi:hypothetical protein
MSKELIEQLANKYGFFNPTHTRGYRIAMLDKLEAFYKAYQAALGGYVLPEPQYMPDPNWKGDVDEATYKAGWNDCLNAIAAAPIDNVAPTIIGIDYASDFIAEKKREAYQHVHDLIEKQLRNGQDGCIDALHVMAEIRALIPDTQANKKGE